MNTQISTKLAALALALMMNSVILGGSRLSVQRPGQQPHTVVSVAEQPRRPSRSAVA